MPGIEARAPLRQLSKQRVFGVAELHAHRLFGLLQGGGHFVAERLRELASLGEEGGAELGADGEAGGDGQSELGHFRQVRPLAAERVLHRRIAFGPLRAEEVNVLLGHFCLPSRDVRKNVPIMFLFATAVRWAAPLDHPVGNEGRDERKSLSAVQWSVKDAYAGPRQGRIMCRSLA